MAPAEGNKSLQDLPHIQDAVPLLPPFHRKEVEITEPLPVRLVLEAPNPLSNPRVVLPEGECQSGGQLGPTAGRHSLDGVE